MMVWKIAELIVEALTIRWSASHLACERVRGKNHENDKEVMMLASTAMTYGWSSR